MIRVDVNFFGILIFLSLLLLISCASGNLHNNDALLTENELQSDVGQQSLDEMFPTVGYEKNEIREEIFSVPHSLDEIEGTWKIMPDGDMRLGAGSIESFRYPVRISNRIYMVIITSKVDMTSFFKEEASRQEISEEELWEKRYTIRFTFSGAKSQDILPFSDRHGTQVGIRWTREFNFYNSPKYFRRTEILVPEFIVSQNLKFFLLSDDKSAMKIKENSKFRFLSEKFEDLNSDSNFSFKKLIQINGIR